MVVTSSQGDWLLWAHWFRFSALAYDVRPHCRFFRQVYAFQTAFASLEKIMDVMEVKEVEYKGKDYAGPLHGDVAFDSVSFAYEEEPVLKDVSFDLGQGQTLAIVGPTGAGKSTF